MAALKQRLRCGNVNEDEQQMTGDYLGAKTSYFLLSISASFRE